MRELDKKTKQALQISAEVEPSIKLEFPDPFGEDMDPASYTEEAAGGGGGKAAKGAVVSDRETRSQTRRLLVSCAKVEDGRAGSGNGTFEVVPSPEFTQSGLFTLSVDKGAVTAGGDVPGKRVQDMLTHYIFKIQEHFLWLSGWTLVSLLQS